MSNKAGKPRIMKIRTMLLSVFLAAIVWYMVMSVTNPSIKTTVSNLNVRFVGESQLHERQLAITGRENIPTLSVSVRGSRSDLMNFMDDIYVQVDVSSITAAGDYNLSGTISIPTTRITVEKENFGDIPITAEPLVSKSLDVSVKQTGVLRDRLVRSVAENPVVIVTGAQSEIEGVAGAVATVDISRLHDESSQQLVTYLLTDESGALINGNETIESKRSEVEITNTVYNAKTLPVEPMLDPELEKRYILKKDKTPVYPPSVTVGVLPTNSDESVAAIIDKLSDGSEQEYYLRETDGMYIPPESAAVRIKPELVSKESAELELDVEVDNVPEGRTASAGSARVSISGEQGTVNLENVHVYVDADGLGEGTHTLPLRIREDQYTFDSPYSVSVTIE